MYSIIVLISLACLTECQYDPSVESSKAGYEEAEAQLGPQVIPAEYGTGKEQLKYVDERSEINVFQEFDQVFDLFKEYVKQNNYGDTEKDIEYAGRLDEIHVEWKHSIEVAPEGVQQDFASTLTSIFNVLTSRKTLNLFNSLVDLWNSFSGTFSRIFKDTPSVQEEKPDWQIDFENAIQQNASNKLKFRRRHHRSTDNNEISSPEMDALAFARQATTTTRRTTLRTTTRRPQTTTRRVQTTTRKVQATTRRVQATTRKAAATTARTVATTRKAAATTARTAATTRKANAVSQTAKQTAEQEQNVDVDNGIHETYIKAPRIINVFIDDDQPAELIAQAVAAQYFEFEKADPNP